MVVYHELCRTGVLPLQLLCLPYILLSVTRTARIAGLNLNAPLHRAREYRSRGFLSAVLCHTVDFEPLVPVTGLAGNCVENLSNICAQRPVH